MRVDIHPTKSEQRAVSVDFSRAFCAFLRTNLHDFSVVNRYVAVDNGRVRTVNNFCVADD